MGRSFGLVLAALLPGLAAGHLEFFCASSVFSNHSQFCNKAIIWLGTYSHNAIPDQDPVPGKAIVYKGPNPVKPEPFTFEKYCATSTSTTGRFDTLSQPPTVNELETFIKGITADDCMPGMEEELSGITQDMKLTCYGLDTSTPIGGDDSARCPSAEYTGGTDGSLPLLGALIPIVLTGVTSTDDISIVVHSTGFEVKRYLGSNDACSVASTETIAEDNTTCYMNILNWDGERCGEGAANTISAKSFPDVEIAGCGIGCGPYTPSSAVTNNDCTTALVESGQTCNIVCPVGETAVGSPVSCQAGSYVGDIVCTNADAAWIGDVRNDSTAAVPNANLDQIQTATGPGCGEWTAVGTTCYITCAFGYFSTGLLLVADIPGQGATWVPTPDAACHATTCGTGTAIPVEGVVSMHSGAEQVISGSTFMKDATLQINQPGCNFDPRNDRIIVIPREEGQVGSCDGSSAAVGGITFDCSGPASDDVLLECTPEAGSLSISYGDLPLFGQICVCDADFEKGCEHPSQFSKVGGVTDTSASPTHAPSMPPTVLPSMPPTALPTPDDSAARVGDDDATTTGKKGKSDHTHDDDDAARRTGDDDAAVPSGKAGKTATSTDDDAAARTGDDDASAATGKSAHTHGNDAAARVGDAASGKAAKTAKTAKTAEDAGAAADRTDSGSGSGSAADRVVDTVVATSGKKGKKGSDTTGKKGSGSYVKSSPSSATHSAAALLEIAGVGIVGIALVVAIRRRAARTERVQYAQLYEPSVATHVDDPSEPLLRPAMV